ncbi:DHS-like NAD/FAD-binding domain-containing protein, partial [Mycena alexandri]
ITGAGASIDAGLPGFTCSTEFFDDFQKEYKKISKNRASVKDLFDIGMLQKTESRKLLIKLVYRMHEASSRSSPTPFHLLLKDLDATGRLTRVYTQNIDGMEARCGLTSGIPEYQEDYDANTRKSGLDGPAKLVLPAEHEIPRCIPVHGTCHEAWCPLCYEHRPIENFAPKVAEGMLPVCPRCADRDDLRARKGLRHRGIPYLLPAIVLYNDAHPHGEAIAETVKRDIALVQGNCHTRSILLVAGTSISIPGIQDIIHSFARAIKGDDSHTASPSVILINDHEPTGRGWKATFDLWLKGDLQQFAKLAHEIMTSHAGSDMDKYF